MARIHVSEVLVAKDKGCCYRLCNCLGGDDEETDRGPSAKNNVLEIEKTNITVHHNHNQPTNLLYNTYGNQINNTNNHNHHHHNNNNNEDDAIIDLVERTTKNFQINSKIPHHLIEYDIKMRRDELVDIKYNCPICLRYLSLE